MLHNNNNNKVIWISDQVSSPVYLFSCCCFFLFVSSKVVGLLWLMGVNKDVSYLSDRVCARPHNPLKLHPGGNENGPVRSEILHGYRLCDICCLARCLYGHRAVLRSVWWASAHHTRVPNGRQKHALSPSFPVAHCLVPVGRGYHRRTSRDLHSRHTVLVHRLCLHPGPPHSSSRFHSSVLPTARLQRLRGLSKHFHFSPIHRLSKLHDLHFLHCFVPQYLELRFSKAVRICGTLTFIFQMVSLSLISL